MGQDRPARARGDTIIAKALRESQAATQRLRAAGFEPGAFILKDQPVRHRDAVAAARRLLGGAALPSGGRQAHAYQVARADPPALSKSGRGDTAVAFGNGLADSLPFGLGDIAAAGYMTVGDTLHLRDPIASYEARMEEQEARNRYDEQHHPLARTAGKVTGTVAQLAVPGMGLARLAGARRMAEAAPLLLRETGKLTGAGMVGGVGSQAVGDVVNRQLSTPADYLGSAAGGGIGTLMALRGRLGYVGSATSAATSLAQDAFNGRLGSKAEILSAAERAREAAVAGNLLSASAGGFGARTAQKLPSFRPANGGLSKGSLGEWLSRRRSGLRGAEIADQQVHREVRDGFTILDHLEVGGTKVEAKFGPAAKLSRRQRQAYEDFLDYRVDHFLPRDIGVAAELPVGMLSYLASRHDDGGEW